MGSPRGSRTRDDKRVAEERRARLQRERERRRAAAATRPSPSSAGRARQRSKQSTAPPGAGGVATRERHEGLVGWAARTVRELPERAAAGLRRFAHEVVAVVAGIAVAAVQCIPGGRFVVDALTRTSIPHAGEARGGAALSVERHQATLAPTARVARGDRYLTPAQQRARQRRRTVLLRRVRLVLLVMIAIGLAVAVHVVPRAGVFDVAHVEIVGASAVSDLDVRQRIDPALRRATIFTVDQGDVARRVRALPFVRSVHIERHVPGGLGIRIVEYRPLAVACTATSCWLLSPDGRILTRAHGSEWRGRVPVVQLLAHKVHAGMRLPDEPGVDVLRALPATSTLAFTSIAATRYSVVGRTTDGVEVRFGRPEAWSTKVAVAQRLIEPLSAKGVEIAYVDVSVPDHTAVCLRDNPVCRDAETVDEVANAHAKRVEALKAIAKMRKGGAPKDAIDEATYRMNNPTAVATAPPTPVTESAVGRAETTQTPTAPQSAHLNAFEAAANGT